MMPATESQSSAASSTCVPAEQSAQVCCKCHKRKTKYRICPTCYSVFKRHMVDYRFLRRDELQGAVLKDEIREAL